MVVYRAPEDLVEVDSGTQWVPAVVEGLAVRIPSSSLPLVIVEAVGGRIQLPAPILVLDYFPVVAVDDDSWLW